jgi:TPR repeat protein
VVSTEALFRIADAAEEAGNYDLALRSFERGASLGDSMCLCRLAYLFDVGVGVETDKASAMRLYRRAWRIDRNPVAGGNIAILYREQKNWRQIFRWWQRVAQLGDGSAELELAKCYLRGQGVRRDPQAALRCLAAAEGSVYITEYERELAQRLLGRLRPRGLSSC